MSLSACNAQFGSILAQNKRKIDTTNSGMPDGEKVGFFLGGGGAVVMWWA